MNAAPQGAVQVDKVAVRSFVAMIHGAAARALDGAPAPGLLQLSMLHPGGRTMIPTRFPIGAVDAMSDTAISAAENGLNVYVEGRTIAPRASGRGKAEDTIGVFALVDDADNDKGKGGTLSLAPSLVVESSPGNRHSWLFLDRAITHTEAEPIGRAMRAATGSDSATAKLTQPYRIAGTPNFPDAQKRARGRVVEATRVLSTDGPVYSAEALRAAFPAVAATASRMAPSGRSGVANASVEAMAAEVGPDRSGRFFSIVQWAAGVGMLPDDLEEVLRRYPDGCASKYLTPKDRLSEEIARAWSKLDAAPTAAARPQGSTTPAEEPEAIVAPAVEPVAIVHGVPVDEARAAVRAALSAHLAMAWPTYHAIRVSTGVGKTRIATELIAADVKRRRAEGDERGFLYAIPRHKLGDEVASLFEAEGVTARVFRGREAENPDTPGTAMCLDLAAIELAQKAGSPISTSCCKGEHPVTGTVIACPFYQSCAYQGQVRDRPDVWIVPHQLLFQAPSGLGEVAGVVIDEGFWAAGVIHAGRGITLDDLAGPNLHGASYLDDAVADLAVWRPILVNALRRQEKAGGVERRHLVDGGVDAELCHKAIRAEWGLKVAATVYPGMDDKARAAARKALDAPGRAPRIRSHVAIWKAVLELLSRDDEAAVSGRLILADSDTEEGSSRVVRTRGLHPITKRWAEAPTFIMDATLPDIQILRGFYPGVEVVADIEATMPHARVRQVLGAPVSANKLLDTDGERNLSKIRRAVMRRFIDAGRVPTLVIAQQRVAEWLEDGDLPEGISVAHFNAIAGLDGFKSVGLLIVIGRTMPSPQAVEADAGAITGLQAATTAAPAKGPRWYNRAMAELRMADGSRQLTRVDRHPDPIAEAIRYQICEGELVQAVGRARGVNRTAADLVDIEVWSDVLLPVTLDAVAAWPEVPQGYGVWMMADGVILDSPADMADRWPGVWSTEKAARRWREKEGEREARALPPNPMESYKREWGQRSFRYQWQGKGQNWRSGRCDPAMVPDPRAWLEKSFCRSLAGFEIVEAG